MNENNQVTTLVLYNSDIGDDGVSALSAALMNKNNKVTRIHLALNHIGTQGLAGLLKTLRFSVVSYLDILTQDSLDYDVQQVLEDFTDAFNRKVPRLVCLASACTISRIGDQSPHFRELSSDILIRVAQTLGWLLEGWFIDYQATIRMLEEHAD